MGRSNNVWVAHDKRKVMLWAVLFWAARDFLEESIGYFGTRGICILQQPTLSTQFYRYIDVELDVSCAY